MSKPSKRSRQVHTNMVLSPNVEMSKEPCPVCGGKAFYVDSGNCVSCHKRECNSKYKEEPSKMRDIERLKEDRELEKLENDYYEDL